MIEIRRCVQRDTDAICTIQDIIINKKAYITMLEELVGKDKTMLKKGGSYVSLGYKY